MEDSYEYVPGTYYSYQYHTSISYWNHQESHKIRAPTYRVQPTFVSFLSSTVDRLRAGLVSKRIGTSGKHQQLTLVVQSTLVPAVPGTTNSTVIVSDQQYNLLP